jgi:hypothetical protein
MPEEAEIGQTLIIGLQKKNAADTCALSPVRSKEIRDIDRFKRLSAKRIILGQNAIVDGNIRNGVSNE